MNMSVGEQLKRARLELHLHLKDATQATKIQPWALEALEADRLHLTMSPIYVKGFLSTYAKFLHLDPETLIAQLFPEPSPPAAEPAVPAALPKTSYALVDAWPMIRRVGVVAMGVAGIALIVLVNPLRWIAPKTSHHQKASLSVSTHQTPPSLATTLSLEPTQPLELSIRAHRTTWVSVRVDGRLLAQQQLAAGSQETWKARRHLELVVSTPSHVEVWLNGQSISPLAVAHGGRLVITHTHITSLAASAE
jgi:cytoskeletal protein RodZ